MSQKIVLVKQPGTIEHFVGLGVSSMSIKIDDSEGSTGSSQSDPTPHSDEKFKKGCIFFSGNFGSY